MAGSVQSFLSSDGQTVDEIVFAYYGDTSGGIVEAVLEANAGLAALGPFLPAGVQIILPDRDLEQEPQGVPLWR